MKKSIALSIILLTATLAFSQEEPVQPEKKVKRFAIEEGLGYHYWSRNAEGARYEYTLSSIAVNFAGNYFFTDHIGIGLYLNFINPLKAVNIPNNDLFDLEDMTLYYNFKFVMDLLFGPVFILYKNEKLSFPISVGFHWIYFSAVTFQEFKMNYNYIGIGVNIAGKYNINDIISLFARFQFSYDLYLVGTSDYYLDNDTPPTRLKNYSEMVNSWNISPSLGISFRF